MNSQLRTASLDAPRAWLEIYFTLLGPFYRENAAK